MVTYTLLQNIYAIYNGDQAVSTIPAGATIEMLAPVPESGVIQGVCGGRYTRVLAIDLRRYGKAGGPTAVGEF